MSQPANTHPLTSQPSQNLAVYAINQQPCSAEEYAAAACDPRRNIAIEACAGSGKTWILVSRILRALLDGIEPQSILAITFTKKAAGEMRTRLVEWLVAFSQEPDDEKLAHELRIRGIAQPDGPLLARLRGLHAHLLEQPHTVQIRTFHGWFGALLQAAPYSVFEALGLPKPYELIEDDTLAIAQVWPLFYTQLQRDAALAADYQSLITDYSRHNAQEMLRNGLGRRLEFARADEYGVVERSLPTLQAAYPELAAYDTLAAMLAPESRLHSLLQEAASDLCASSKKKHQEHGQALRQGLEQGDMEQCCAALFTKAQKLRAGLPAEASIMRAESILLQMLDWQGYPRALAHQARMTRLLRVLLAQYQALKVQRAWVDMNDLELAAHRLLTDPELAAWMQERLDNQVRQVLIDEFQDTSPLQWQILSDWLSGYAGAGGGQAPLRVFLVGDPKQSIYRFRNAEPRVFLAAQDMVRETLGGDLLSCDHTRRNAQAIIRTLNQLMTGCAMQGFRPHSSASAESGQVLVSCLPATAKPDSQACQSWRDSLHTPRSTEAAHNLQAELETVAQWLQQKIQTEGVPASDCMVLARRHDDLHALDAVLSARGIAAIRVEKQTLPDYMEVQDLLALLDVLHSPSKNSSLAQVLKSPLGGWSDADLTQLALQAQSVHSTWWQALQDLSASSQPTWQPLAARLLEWQALLGQLPAYDVLFSIYAQGDVLARYAAASPSAKRERTLGNLRALLQAALDFQGGRFSSTWQFLRALKDERMQAHFKAPGIDSSQAVRLLTVHGAKGLEAEHVVLLNCQPSAKGNESYGVYTDWPAESQHPTAFIFRTTAAETPDYVNQLMLQEQELQAREALNGLYVAITRARSSVLVSATENSRSPANNWWALLQQHVKPESYAQLSSVLKAPSTKAAEPPLEVIQMAQLPQLVATTSVPTLNTQISDTAASAESRRGQALHRLLEWQVQGDLSPQMQARLMRDYQLEAAECLALAAQAQQMQSGPAAWIWDAAHITWGANELELAHEGQVLRLDRLVQATSSQDWWVIDYKSALQPEHDAALQAQMQQYCLAVQAWQGASARVRGAWVTGAGRWAELATE